MDDLIEIAAYAIILMIIGIVSFIKKIQAEQKRRQRLAAKPARERPVDRPRGLRPVATPKVEPAPPGVVGSEPLPVAEEEPEEKEEAPSPVFDMEEVLRRALGYPAEEARPVVRKPSRRKVPKPRPIQPAEEKVSLPQPEPPKIKPPSILPTHLGWSDFVETLKSRNLSELQRAIIFTEVFSPPLALRRGKQFWQRGRLFG